MPGLCHASGFPTRRANVHQLVGVCMYGFQDGLTGSIDILRPGGSLGGRLLSLLTLASLAGISGGCAIFGFESNRTARIALEPAPYIESGYIGLFEAPEELPETEVLSRPSPAPLGAAYARRYEISEELATDIVEHALDQGIDPDLAFRLIRVESVFQVRARGPHGALGLTQLMPGTARGVDRSLRTEGDILEPTNNLRVGFIYLRRLIDRYGEVRLALLAYNRGQGNVDRALRRGVDPENGYSRKVLGTGGSNPYSGPGVVTRVPRSAG